MVSPDASTALTSCTTNRVRPDSDCAFREAFARRLGADISQRGIRSWVLLSEMRLRNAQHPGDSHRLAWLAAAVDTLFLVFRFKIVVGMEE